MITFSIRPLAPALATLLVFGAAPIVTVTSALAYDDDVEVICGENDNGEDWCVTVDELKAECPLSDPEYTSDECQGLLHGRPGGGTIGGFVKTGR